MLGLVVKFLGIQKDFADAKEWLGKRWFLSKVLWVNVISFIALQILPRYYPSITLSAEEQTSLLVIINLILRFFTNQPLVTRKEDIVQVEPVPKVSSYDPQ